MDNVYVLVTYLAVVIGLVGVALLKIGDIFEQKRERKYYEMLKEDVAFWQMKIEQSGTNLAYWIIEKKADKEIIYKQFNEEETEKKNEDLFEGLDEWLPF